MRQLLTESVMLALLGGAAGMVLAVGGVRLLRGLGTTLNRMDLAQRALRRFGRGGSSPGTRCVYTPSPADWRSFLRSHDPPA